MEDAGGLCRQARGAGHKSLAREGRHLQEGWGPEEGRHQTGASWGPKPLAKSGSGPGCSGVICKVPVPHRMGVLVWELCGSVGYPHSPGWAVRLWVQGTQGEANPL